MKWLLKKLVIFLLTLLAISLLAFLAFQMIPGDPALSLLGTEATPERVEALREKMGLNDPIILQFGRWLFHFVRGDMGTSYSYQMSVSEMLKGKLIITLTLTGLSFVFIILLSIPIGIFGIKKGGFINKLIGIVNQIIMAVPPFFSGILLTYFFGVVLKVFRPGGFVSYEQDGAGFFVYLLVPSLAIALPKAAMTIKFLQDSILKEMNQDYVRTALSRGNSQGQVLYHHILKNAMIPVITFLAMALADMVAGSIIIEQIFSIPGIGRMLIASISNRDYPVVQAIVVLMAFLVVGLNFLADILYQKLDPRMGGQKI